MTNGYINTYLPGFFEKDATQFVSKPVFPGHWFRRKLKSLLRWCAIKPPKFKYNCTGQRAFEVRLDTLAKGSSKATPSSINLVKVV